MEGMEKKKIKITTIHFSRDAFGMALLILLQVKIFKKETGQDKQKSADLFFYGLRTTLRQ
jgi:predicted nucleic acid-binding protein